MTDNRHDVLRSLAASDLFCDVLAMRHGLEPLIYLILYPYTVDLYKIEYGNTDQYIA